MSKELNQRIEELAEKVFKNGKNPFEAFGFNWEMLIELDKKATSRASCEEKQRKIA